MLRAVVWSQLMMVQPEEGVTMSRDISRLFMAILALVAAVLPAQAYIDP